jgi:hypothetical protein
MDTENTLRELLHKPHVIAAGIIAFGVVAASLVYTSYSGVESAAKNTLPIAPNGETKTVEHIAEKDENANGIPDWQEVTLSELGANTDAKNTAQNADIAATIKKNYTKTEILAGDLFGVYLQRKEANQYTEQDNEKIITNALLGLDIEHIPQFTKDTLTVTANTDADAQKYKDTMSTIVHSLEAISEYELVTYARATEKNDAKEFAKLSSAADVYALSVELMKGVHVPGGAIEAHIALMNSFTKVSLSLLEMSRGYDDVAGSYAALKTFGVAEQEVDYAFTLQRTYLALHNAL